ncbi:hypothetical protein M378DRAFT_167827 [Amanita muscaria Koide BX008]|uniref:Uncharacterized protein n=1 Tax=Amanita muscaria (strain Koide BX008) TaxID=946122 RepID=A0A0C2T2L8_AMAMK|nr:hypothetical protein M378DRAFT_167827 [Amanita muscaria Koide BX008]
MTGALAIYVSFSKVVNFAETLRKKQFRSQNKVSVRHSKRVVTDCERRIRELSSSKQCLRFQQSAISMMFVVETSA